MVLTSILKYVQPCFGPCIHTVGNYDFCLCRPARGKVGERCKTCSRIVAHKHHAEGRKHKAAIKKWQAAFLVAIQLFIVAAGFFITTIVLKSDLTKQLVEWQVRFDQAHTVNFTDVFVPEQTAANWCYYSQLVVVSNVAHYEFKRVPCNLEHIFWKTVADNQEAILARITNFGVGWFNLRKTFYRGFGLDIARNNALYMASSFATTKCADFVPDELDEFAEGRLGAVFEASRKKRRYYGNIKRDNMTLDSGVDA